MDVTNETKEEQRKLWNSLGGRAWVEAQGALDRLFKPFEDLLVESVGAKSRRQVLDVGCGTGSTTLAVARLLGAKGRCTGIDLSEPMIAAAQARAEHEHNPARFICADAQTYDFEPASVDMIMSRFGVMFFADPVVAFANLRHAARDNAELQVIAWRSAAENPFMTTAERAASPLLPNLPVRRQDGPGQFAFANAPHVRNILEESGWTAIDVRPIDVACTFPETELIRYFTLLGPVGRIVQESDERTRAQVIETVRPAFDSYVHGAEVRFTAASWMVSARAGSA
ncbi:MAG TPA: class I SAM-dependent methyltransferase [Vicinamibacterales bacterium]|jgi:ubiquinone/menaquinone biosynthesis C-methylase UbiE